MFRTGTGKKIDFDRIPDAILDFYERNRAYGEAQIIVGTDSQNFSDTKIVSVIAVVSAGHGGIFFYEVSRTDKIQSVKQKLQRETGDSLILAGKLVDALESDDKYAEMYSRCPLAIHVDAGNSDKGKTKPLIPELVGWIRACGYDVRTKPDSFVASSIADRLSK